MHTTLYQLSDNELHLSYKLEDNKEALGVLFDRYYHTVYGVCLKYLEDSEKAKDAAMSIFEKLIKDLKEHDIEYFKAWLYMVSKNYCLMQLRKKTPLTKQLENVEPFVMETDDTIHHIREQEMQLDAMHTYLHELPTEQKKCIELFYLQKKTYNDICTETGFTFMQVKSFIQNGKRNLKLKLTNTTNE